MRSRYRYSQQVRGATRRAVVAVFAAGLLAACASMQSRKPEDIVRERASARWHALLAGNAELAYSYISPSGRALISLVQWRGAIGRATVWKSAKVHEVTCETSEKCIVRVEVVHQPLQLRGKLGTITTSVDETWLIDGGQWWWWYKR